MHVFLCNIGQFCAKNCVSWHVAHRGLVFRSSNRQFLNFLSDMTRRALNFETFLNEYYVFCDTIRDADLIADIAIWERSEKSRYACSHNFRINYMIMLAFFIQFSDQKSKFDAVYCCICIIWLPDLPFLFFFRIHYMDFPDCLLLLLSISVSLLFSFFSCFYTFLVVGSVR